MITWWLACSSAIAGTELSLSDVLDAVSVQHPLLDAQLARVEAARGDQRAALGAFDPKLKAETGQRLGKHQTSSLAVGAPLGTLWGADLSVGWRRGVGDFAPYEGKLETGEAGDWTMGIDLPLLRDAWTDRSRTSLASARQAIGVADAELEQQRLTLARNAGLRWVAWVVAGRRVEIARRIAEVAELRDKAFETQETLGEVSAFVRLDNRRLLIERRERLVVAERELERAAIDLSVWLRDEAGQPIIPDPSLLPAAFDAIGLPELEDPIGEAVNRRPELRRFQILDEQLRLERRLQTNQLLPSIDLVARAYLPVDASPGEKIDLGVAADWAVPARAARGRADALDANRLRVAGEMRFAADRIAADVQDAESAARAASRRIAAARELLAVAREVEEGERARFELGDSNLIFVNQRELSTAEAELLLIDAIAASWRAWIEFEWSIGRLGAG